MTTSFSRDPYFDDLDQNSKFLRVMFKPGRAVQARELNQLQSIINRQSETFGKHIFKTGAVVIPGAVSIDTDASFVKVNGTTLPADLIGKTIRGNTTGVEALVIQTVNAENGDPATIYMKYTSSGTNGVTKVFNDGETLRDLGALTIAVAVSTNATGTGSISSIEAGFYFIKNFFVRVEAQTIVLDKYTNVPSCKIGLDAIESFINEDDDPTLLDNASGTYNYAAPGADRYLITLNFVKKGLDAVVSEEDFILLVLVRNGTIQHKVDNTEYSLLEKTFARRTFDESGDYTVREFPIDVREYRNNFRESWLANTTYLAGDVVTYNNGGVVSYYRARKNGTSSAVAPIQLSGYSTEGSTGVIWSFEKIPYFNRGINIPPIGLSGETIPEMLVNEAKFSIGIEPGKAYVGGYEIEKISTSFVTVPKARDTNSVVNSNMNTVVGNYCIISNLNAYPDISTYDVVSLYNVYTDAVGVISTGTKVGTCRIRYIEMDADPKTTSQVIRYKASIFDVKMESGYTFSRDVKQMFLSRGSSVNSFSADVFPLFTGLSGTISNTTTTVNGTGTLFTTQLKVGDYIGFLNAGLPIVARVATIPSDILLTINTAFSTAAVGRPLSLVQTNIFETGGEPLLYFYPQSPVASVNDTSTTYTVARTFSAMSSTNSLVLNSTWGTFATPLDAGNYIVVNASGVAVTPTFAGYSPGQTSITIGLPAAANQLYTVIGALDRSGSTTRRTKSIESNGLDEFKTAAAAQANVIRLTNSDGYRINSIMMSTQAWGTASPSYTIDISSRYLFDDGQRDAFYDVASLVLASGETPPSGPIKVTYEYFSHSGGGDGDYFNVNSYTGTMDFDDIPSYRGIRLSNLMDFRSKISFTGFSQGIFPSAAMLPKRGNNTLTSFSYYLPRRSTIVLNRDGSLFSLNGASSSEAKEPTMTSNGMQLYKLAFNAYTGSTDDISIDYIDNKRYTMRDIGKLEKRIDQVEYYTSLSLLETAGQTMDIQDSNGLNRYKNGFIVDNFSGSGPGDFSSSEYSCALDVENGIMRPEFDTDNISIVEENSNNAGRAIANYTTTGDLITLPYTETILVAQKEASRVSNVNPFAIFTFFGSADLNPPSDEWFEVNRLPDIVTNVEGNYQTMFNTLSAAGALNTVWNSWQNQWTGSPVTILNKYATGDNNSWGNQDNIANGATFLSLAEANAKFGVVSGNAPARRIVSEISTVTTGRSRSGIRTVVVPRLDKTITDDKVLARAIIPYIRARNLLFVVRGLKPNTVFTPFFDSVNVGAFTKSSWTINVTKESGQIFSHTVRAGGLSSEVSRLVNGNTEAALDRGDVVYVSSRGGINYTQNDSPTTAILALRNEPINGDNIFHIVNMKVKGGSTGFLVGDTITGSITGAVSTVQSAANIGVIPPMKTNASGDVVGIFIIPNTDENRFRCGTRIFKLSDDSLGSDATSTSSVKKQYKAEGILETKQASVTSTRNFELAQETVNENGIVTTTSEQVVSDTGWYDPLAQTFMVQSKGGAFITSVEIFFASRDTSLPIKLHIREVVNGYPGKVIIPFSETLLMPSKVTISNIMVNTSDGMTLPAPLPTKFVFDSPVYLADKTEYCIVLMSDSNNYKVWISHLGDVSVVTNQIISEQPYAGVLFRSQNASTWTADQADDLMFIINKAAFQIGTSGYPSFVNVSLPTRGLPRDPIQVVSGKSVVRIYHPNHGLVPGGSVTLSGITGVPGIADIEFNKTHTSISGVELDFYVITIGVNAVQSGNYGGLTVVASRNIQYGNIQPVIAQQVFADTSLSYGIKTISGKSMNGGETPYVLDLGYSNVSINNNNEMYSTRMIANPANESNNILGGGKSLRVLATMKTSNPNVSPVIDIARLSAILVQNRINNPSLANINTNLLDDRIIWASTDITVTAPNKINAITSNAKAALLTLAVGKKISVAGFSGGSITNNTSAGSEFTVIETSETGDYIKVISGVPLITDVSGPTVTITAKDRYISEIGPRGSSSVAKYVTKKVTFANPSTYLKIRFAADVGQYANLQVYYKLQQADSVSKFENTAYTLATPNSAILKTDDDKFLDVDYSLQNLPAFNAVVVKIVLTSSSSTSIAKVRDLIIIGTI